MRHFLPILLLCLPAPALAAVASDFREPFHREVLAFEELADALHAKGLSLVAPENAMRQRILAELREYACRAELLAEHSATDQRKTEAFRDLARINDLAGYIAADIPRSLPFDSLVPLARDAQAALDKLNRAASLYFGAFQPDGLAFRFATEVAMKASKMPDYIRETANHSGRRHGLVRTFEEFSAHARAYSAALGDPLATEPGRFNRLRLLMQHADRVDRAITKFHANEYVRAQWNGIHDSLRMLRWRYDLLSRGT